MEEGEKAGRGETRRQAPQELVLPEAPGAETGTVTPWVFLRDLKES